jgi:hypothetical protein
MIWFSRELDDLASRPTRTAEPIEITCRRVGDRYVFAAADYKVLIVHDDPIEAGAGPVCAAC